MRKIQLIKLRPTLIGGQFPILETSVVSVEVKEDNSTNEFLELAYKEIDCNCIDIVSFGNPYESNSFSATVDDEGLLKSGNVVMELTIPIEGEEKVTLQLSGTVLIGHSATLEGKELDGLYEVGLTDEQIKYVNDNLECNVIGVVR